MSNSISLRWRDAQGDGVIKTLIEWDRLPNITKIDALSDWIFELEELKHAVCEEEFK